MKTAISIPQEVFLEAEHFAHQAKKSRSRLYRLALEEYMARHAPDRVTAAMDRACDSVGETSQDPFSAGAARRLLKRSEW